MSYFSDYVKQQLNFSNLEVERKKQLTEISKLRDGNDVLVYAADLSGKSSGQQTAINYSDLTPFVDQLRGLSGKSLDLIIETPGGIGEIAEELVKICRKKYSTFSVIVPGWAKSAGTLITMAADEILMCETSAVGPIDAQLNWQGKVFSAGELLDGIQKIQDEALTSGSLNRAYIPILQGISPGELQRAQNALDFAKTLVTDWLARFKFRPGRWDIHSSTNLPVTEQDRIDRAHEIADTLADHKKWLTHNRSIRMEDLLAMRLRITDFGANPQLAEAIHRYHALMQLTFETGNAYKLFETSNSQIYRLSGERMQSVDPAIARALAQKVPYIEAETPCKKCGKPIKIQLNFQPNVPAKGNNIALPADNVVRCPLCLHKQDHSQVREEIEKTTGRKVVS